MPMYDVIVVENGIVVGVTVWQRMELLRAIGLAERTQADFPEWQVGICAPMSARIGSKVDITEETFTIQLYAQDKNNRYPNGKVEKKAKIFKAI